MTPNHAGRTEPWNRILTTPVIWGALFVLWAGVAHSTEVTLEWSWPTNYCDSTDTVDPADIEAAEIYGDTSPIPAASDAAGDPCNSPVDVPPAIAPIATIVTTDTQVVVDLPQGTTYYFRMRVQVNGEWSNLSVQAVEDIPYAQPGVPVIIRIN